MVMELKNYIDKASMRKADIARVLGVSPALVHQWAEKIRPVAIRHCVGIERLTHGGVSRKDLRPDDWHLIWPELITPTKEAP